MMNLSSCCGGNKETNTVANPNNPAITVQPGVSAQPAQQQAVPAAAPPVGAGLENPTYENPFLLPTGEANETLDRISELDESNVSSGRSDGLTYHENDVHGNPIQRPKQMGYPGAPLPAACSDATTSVPVTPNTGSTTMTGVSSGIRSEMTSFRSEGIFASVDSDALDAPPTPVRSESDSPRKSETPTKKSPRKDKVSPSPKNSPRSMDSPRAE